MPAAKRIIQVLFKSNGFALCHLFLEAPSYDEKFAASYIALHLRKGKRFEHHRFSIAQDHALMPAPVLIIDAARNWANGTIWNSFPEAPELLRPEINLFPVRSDSDLIHHFFAIGLESRQFLEQLMTSHATPGGRVCAEKAFAAISEIRVE